MKTKGAAKKGPGDALIALIGAAFRRRLKNAGFSAKAVTLILRARVEAETEAVYAWIKKPQKGGR